jgi:hypothetical protein
MELMLVLLLSLGRDKLLLLRSRWSAKDTALLLVPTSATWSER